MSGSGQSCAPTWRAQLNLVDPTKPDFRIAWVVDFPSFMWDEEEKRWVANHHPFTSPTDEGIEVMRRMTDADLTRQDSPLAQVRAKAYDLVINGYECGGGSIRIHNPEVQSLLFKILGMSPEQARARFGFLLDALASGAPPHGGIALGLDRWAMMLAGTTNIRDVIAFPKNQRPRFDDRSPCRSRPKATQGTGSRQSTGSGDSESILKETW